MLIPLTDLARRYKHKPFKNATARQASIVAALKESSSSMLSFFHAMIARNLWVVPGLNGQPQKWRLEAVLRKLKTTPLLPDPDQNDALRAHLEAHLGDVALEIVPDDNPPIIPSQLSLFTDEPNDDRTKKRTNYRARKRARY